jgi:hypothetical protein
MSVETCSTTWFWFNISIRNWKVWDLVSAPLSDLENVLQLLNYNKVIQKRTFWLCNLCNLWNFIWKSKGLFQFQLKTRTCFKHFKNELHFCKEFGSEDKLYCGTYCYNIIIYDTRCLENSWHLFDDVLKK